MSKRRHYPVLSKFSPDPFRQPVHVLFPHQPRCPYCGCDLDTISVKPHWFPYIHVDVAFQCMVCDRTFTLGIPQSRDAGLALHVFDSNPIDAVAKFKELGVRECPWGHGPMLPTKIFGDWVPPDDEVEYQWKCQVCYLTIHESVKRNFPHGSPAPLTEEEQKLLEERLRKLGYLD